MNRTSRLTAMASQITKDLTEWVRQEDLLGPGERLFVSLRIERDPVVFEPIVDPTTPKRQAGDIQPREVYDAATLLKQASQKVTHTGVQRLLNAGPSFIGSMTLAFEPHQSLRRALEAARDGRPFLPEEYYPDNMRDTSS